MTMTNGRAFFVSRHELNEQGTHHQARFLSARYQRFCELVQPRQPGGDDLVLVWKSDYEELLESARKNDPRQRGTVVLSKQNSC